MKRLIYITYLSLLALMLISCQKEAVGPGDALAASSTEEARNGACRSYHYFTKTGIVQLGSARNDYILVGFADNVTQAQQQTLLSQYSIFDRLEGDYLMDSGIITTIKLQGNGTCSSVKSMLAGLERKKQVKFATPVFDDPNAQLAWLGQTNEIIVTLKDPAYYPALQQLASVTKTTVVTNLFGPIYIVGADKNSVGNALQMTGVFNAASFVDSAEPNFLCQLPPLKTGSKPQLKQSKEFLGGKTAL